MNRWFFAPLGMLLPLVLAVSCRHDSAPTPIIAGLHAEPTAPPPRPPLAPDVILPTAPKQPPAVDLPSMDESIPPTVMVVKAEPPAPVPLVALPPPPLLTERGREMIYAYEVGGGRAYYERYLARPTWPEAASGVTVGIGYDLGYNSRDVILADWKALPERDRQRLAACAGVTGSPAKAKAAQVRDIVIPWALASEVFERVTVTRFWQLSKRTWPGFTDLRDTARDSLLSLTFNRGSSMVGERRRHMRNIRDLSPRADYDGMARQEEAMVSIWAGTKIEQGMKRRRYAEAALMRRALP